MKELKGIDSIYLEDYDIKVNKYLTEAQIQQIVNAIIQFDTWAEREENKNILVLYHATDMTKDDIEKYPYDILQSSGLIDTVVKNIDNYEEINKAVNWTEGMSRTLNQIAKELGKMMKNHEKTSKK